MTNEQKLEYILNAVAQEWGVTTERVRSKCRKRKYVEPRQVYCRLSFFLTTATLTQIGKLLNGRDHTTVIHSIDKIKDRINTEPVLKQQVARLNFKVKDVIMPGAVRTKGHIPPFPGIALLYRPYPKLMMQS